MPENEELKPTAIDDDVASIGESEPTLFHSCSRPDIVEIGGKEIKMDKSSIPKQEEHSPWSMVGGFMRQAEEKFLSFIKKPK